MDELNENNYLINIEDVQKILEKANIYTCPKNIELYRDAFTHKSYVSNEIIQSLNKLYKSKNNIVDYRKNCYERLEFYGDSIVGSTTVEYLFMRFPKFDEGVLTKIKTQVVSRDYLSMFANQFGFQKYLLISKYIENSYGRDCDRILEDCFEAFVGAISMDIGYDNAKKFILKCLDSYVNYSALLHTNENYKDRILNYFQVSGWNFPVYVLATQVGPPTKRTFVTHLYKKYKSSYGMVNEKITVGYGFTKKDAEMDASYNALKKYNMLEKHEYK
jgi:ribonuclease-3